MRSCRCCFVLSVVIAALATEYRAEPSLGIFVPDEMKETYYDGTEASAQYTSLRRFEVNVESERIELPPTDAPTGDADSAATKSGPPSR